MPEFDLVTDLEPAGDQPEAIAGLVEGIERGDKFQTLLGITGSGKSFTIANVIAQAERPTLVLAPNKSLAAQLAAEFREMFPRNRVEYFVSYYDYYQPEAYIPSSDTYIEKDSSINDEIDRLRHSATSALLTRRDVIIVASVSAIYGLGSPEMYAKQLLMLSVGEERDQRSILRRLVELQYERNDFAFARNKFRVRGDTIEVFPAYEERAVRIQLFGDEVERMCAVDPLTGEIIEEIESLALFPASHYTTDEERLKQAITGIEAELFERLAELEGEGKLLEAQRLRMRTTYDLEMLREVGSCSGVENYSMHLDGRVRHQPPYTLLDYFPEDWLCVVDESHVAIPQLHGQFEGDRSRKETLVAHGFRLPSAMDNRPLRFEEFMQRVNQVVFLSATPEPVRARDLHEGRRAGRAPDRPHRPRGDRQADQGPDRRSRRRDQGSHRRRSARARHDAHQEDVGGPHRLPARARRPRALPALRGRHARTHRDPAVVAARRVRRARRDQPAARRARPARGVARRDPRRRQGRLPALGDVADPDDGARRAQHRRSGDHVRRPRDRLDALRDLRDDAAPPEAARVQPRARHRSADDPQEGHRHSRDDPSAGRRRLDGIAWARPWSRPFAAIRRAHRRSRPPA